MERTTEFVARFISELKYEDIPREVIERAKRQILDIIGVAVTVSLHQIVARIEWTRSSRCQT